MNQKKIIVVGSGTAGLVTALIIKSAMPAYEVIIVSSSKRGIIGVGEGSTEHWQLFQTFQTQPSHRLVWQALYP
jgi:aspartate oxidase